MQPEESYRERKPQPADQGSERVRTLAFTASPAECAITMQGRAVFHRKLRFPHFLSDLQMNVPRGTTAFRGRSRQRPGLLKGKRCTGLTYCARVCPLPLLPSGPGGVYRFTPRAARPPSWLEASYHGAPTGQKRPKWHGEQRTAHLTLSRHESNRCSCAGLA